MGIKKIIDTLYVIFILLLFAWIEIGIIGAFILSISNPYGSGFIVPTGILMIFSFFAIYYFLEYCGRAK